MLDDALMKEIRCAFINLFPWIPQALFRQRLCAQAKQSAKQNGCFVSPRASAILVTDAAFWRAFLPLAGYDANPVCGYGGVWDLVRTHPMDNDRSCHLIQAQMQDTQISAVSQ